MKLIYTLSFVLIAVVSHAQDSAKVLFIGNSYTYVNDLPSLVTNLANSLGDYVSQSSSTAGGATLSNHAANNNTYTLINSDQWDFVVLQAQSQEPAFPDNQVDSQTIPYAIQIADSVYDNYFCSDVMMFMTWGRENGDPQWQPISTYDGMQSRLRNAYLRMADSVQGSVSPVGMAWKRVRDNYPSIQLYTGDGSHPSMEGSYLAACTFYASIFRKSPVGATFISTVDTVVALQLQQAAHDVVLDSLDHWNLRPISEHTQANFTFSENQGTVDFENLSTKAQTYFWDFGNGQTDTAVNPSITYASIGTYTVTLIAQSPCDTDTISSTVVINSLNVFDSDFFDFRLMSLGEGEFRIVTDKPISEVHIYNTVGQEIFRTSDERIDLSAMPPGIYLMKVVLENQTVELKVQR